MKKILIIDDEPDMLELLRINLLREKRYEVVTATNGATGLKRVTTEKPDLIILDVMMPERNGLEVCKILRNDPVTRSLRIIMLSARAAEMDRVTGFELGADDYLTKPFSMRELMVRIKKLLDSPCSEVNCGKIISHGNLTIDPMAYAVTLSGKSLDLTKLEFGLLVGLARRKGEVLSRDEIFDTIWGYEGKEVESRSIDTHVRRLRMKLGDMPEEYIETVRGVGYRFRERALRSRL